MFIAPTCITWRWREVAIFCPACGAENPDSAKYCNLCFAEIVFEEDDFPGAGTIRGLSDQVPIELLG